MALAGGIGAEIALSDTGPAHALLFGEDQARYLVTLANDASVDALAAAAEEAAVPVARLGRTDGDSLTVSGVMAISLSELRAAHEGWLPAYMAG